MTRQNEGLDLADAGDLAEHQRASRMVRAVGGLTAMGFATTALAFVSGPLQARILGPTGRGELAAVLAVAGIMPLILGLGLNAFVAREVARGERKAGVLGTTAALSIALGCLGYLVAVPISNWVAQGNANTRTLILLAMALLPLSIAALTLMGAIWGRQQWRRLAMARFISQALLLGVYVLLAVTDTFTVTTAAIAAILISFVACAPALQLLRGFRTWRVDRLIAAQSLRFGTRASVSTVAQQSNARLDQILMAGIVPASELGQYVVAVTLASFGMVVVTALNYAVLPTVASGARHAVQPVLRLTLWGIGLVSIALAILAPLVIPLLFGARFAESVPLAQILTLGTPFLAGNAVLTSAFVGDGRPGETAVAETLAAAFTVPALILLLPTYGATAAAMTSVVAYGVSFTFLLYRARRFFGGSFSAFLFPRYADLATIAAVGVTGRRRRRT